MQFFTENEPVSLSDMDIQWHPAFCAAAELELSANRAELDFHREYNLSKKPLQIDLLVIKKPGDVRIENEIGHIFRQHNIVEYKSPDGGLSIDDFFKTIGYACIYKGLSETADQIPIEQMTVSLFRESHPRGLFRSLKKNGFKVQKKYNGIYYIGGIFFPVQIVVTRELEGWKHRSLRILSRNAQEEDIRGFVEGVQTLVRQGDRANADAILQVSAAANSETYNNLVRRFHDMNDALRWIMRDEIKAGWQQGIQEGRQQGIQQGMQQGIQQGMQQGIQQGRQEGMQQGVQQGKQQQAKDTALKLHDMGMPVDKIAKAVNVSIDTVQKWLTEQPTPV